MSKKRKRPRGASREEVTALCVKLETAVDGAPLNSAIEALALVLCGSLHSIGHDGENVKVREWVDRVQANMHRSFAIGINCIEKDGAHGVDSSEGVQ